MWHTVGFILLVKKTCVRPLGRCDKENNFQYNSLNREPNTVRCLVNAMSGMVFYADMLSVIISVSHYLN